MAETKGGAVLQMEFDVSRFITGMAPADHHGEFVGSTPWGRVQGIAKTCVLDTIRHGGTFVLVVGGGKITMVQRAEAVDLDEAEPARQTPDGQEE